MARARQTTLPYAVAFTDAGQPVWALLLVDAVFLVDVFVHCVTAYRDPATAHYVHSPRRILTRYARTTLLIDVLALAPLWLLGKTSGRYEHGFELLKLLRLRHLPRSAMRERRITSGSAHLYEVLTHLSLFLLLLHLCACTHQLVARAASSADGGASSRRLASDLAALEPAAALEPTAAAGLSTVDLAYGHERMLKGATTSLAAGAGTTSSLTAYGLRTCKHARVERGRARACPPRLVACCEG